tara:strand:+ start:36 stop:356 length:321 start_codon:yes stop_codon:yes gene_type:complete
MTKTNIKANHIKIENLYKSMFSEIKQTSLNLSDKKVEIIHLDDKNQDPAIVDLSETKFGYVIGYWDGYSLSEIEESSDLMKALRIFKRYAKKMAKNLKRYSSHSID